MKNIKTHMNKVVLGLVIALGAHTISVPSLSHAMTEVSASHNATVSSAINNLIRFLDKNKTLASQLMQKGSVTFTESIALFGQALISIDAEIVTPLNKLIAATAITHQNSRELTLLLTCQEIITEARGKLTQIHAILKKNASNHNVVSFKSDLNPILDYLASPSTLAFFETRLAKIASILEELQLKEHAAHVKMARTRLIEEFNKRKGQKATPEDLKKLKEFLCNK